MNYWGCDVTLADHPKVCRLGELLRVPWHTAVGLVCTLYCRVAQHAEDGNLTNISDATIAHWLRWGDETEKLLGTGHRIVTALEGAGILDGGSRTIHGWAERYAAMIAKRDRQRDSWAGQKRRQRSGKDGNVRGGQGADMGVESARCPPPVRADDINININNNNNNIVVKPAGSTTPLSEKVTSVTRPDSGGPAALVTRWNALAAELSLPRVEKLTAERRRRAEARIRDGLLDRFEELAAALRAIPFYRGENDRGWRADWGWLMTADGWLKAVERAAAGPAPASTPRPGAAGRLSLKAEIARCFDENGDARPEEELS